MITYVCIRVHITIERHGGGGELYLRLTRETRAHTNTHTQIPNTLLAQTSRHSRRYWTSVTGFVHLSMTGATMTDHATDPAENKSNQQQIKRTEQTEQRTRRLTPPPGPPANDNQTRGRGREQVQRIVALFFY